MQSCVSVGVEANSWAAPRVRRRGHPVDPVERHQFLTGEPIEVGEHVWIGAGAMVLPGVHIGIAAVIAAGTVVSDDVPQSSLVAGPRATRERLH